MSISYSSSEKREPLQQVLQRPDLWKGRGGPVRCSSGLSTGHPDLDKKLLYKGWPQRGLVELQQNSFGHAEWHLLLPSMKALLAEPGYIFLINPPAIPYAPALVQQGIDPKRLLVVETDKKRDCLASVLEILAANCSIAVCFWEPKEKLFYAELRKLQLAASHSSSLCFLMRNTASEKTKNYSSSPAVLKLRLQNYPQGLRLSIYKQRGSYRQGEILLPWPNYLISSPFLKPEYGQDEKEQGNNILCFKGNS